jgi:carbamoylphosphate synthase large subunit
MINVLIFPGGSEIGLEINNALKYSKFVKVFGGTSVCDHSDYVYSNLITNIPYLSEPTFLTTLNSILEKYDIDYLYPALDSVQMYLTEHEDEINATIITSPLQTVQICRSKSKTYDFFSEYDFVPKIFLNTEDIKNYPVFVKPSIGCGSIDAVRVDNGEELIAATWSKEIDYVICEYLPGSEFTVDCFTDKDRNLRVVKTRNRSRIKAGISVHSQIQRTPPRIREIASIINTKLTFNGAWFFQLKETSDMEYKLLEISARIPGTMGLSRNCGINFPLLTLYNHLKYDVSIIDNEYDIRVDRAFISRYRISIEYETVYLDLDDTLILPNNTVNTCLMMFLYQLVNDGKKIIMLSKNGGDLRKKLETHHIPISLFKDIIQISQDKKKSDYITDHNAIFIDDSFSERKDVFVNAHIPVFDLDMVESLIDWRQ